MAFPPAHVAKVRVRLRELFATCHATGLVCSAACGADLLALEVAQSLGIPCRVVLPFTRQRFRRTSVVDRPGAWGALFDAVLTQAEQIGSLIELNVDKNLDANQGENLDEQAQQAYLRANDVILEEARALAEARGEPLAVVLVWEGAGRGAADTTRLFGEAARRLGIQVLEVSTL